MNTNTATTLQEIVADCIENMSESLKPTFRNTTRNTPYTLDPGAILNSNQLLGFISN